MSRRSGSNCAHSVARAGVSKRHGASGGEDDFETICQRLPSWQRRALVTAMRRDSNWQLRAFFNVVLTKRYGLFRWDNLVPRVLYFPRYKQAFEG